MPSIKNKQDGILFLYGLIDFSSINHAIIDQFTIQPVSLSQLVTSWSLLSKLYLKTTIEM